MSQPPEKRQHLEPAVPPWEQPTELDAFATAERDDARDVVTQRAFRIAPALLGLPLATPRQRAIAMAIDSVLVLMLAQAGGVLLAALAAVFAYSWLRSRNKSQTKLARGLSMSAYVMLALLIFSLIVSVVQPFWERYVSEEGEQSIAQQQKKTEAAAKSGDDALTLKGGDGVALTLATVGLGFCNDASCRKDVVQGISAKLAEADAKPEAKLRVLDSMIDDEVSDEAERETLKTLAREQMANPSVDADKAIDPSLAAIAASAGGEQEDHEYSLLKQASALLDDLGLSLGWAAAYFTLFTTLWAGQTPGKRVMRIRVVQLTGKPLSYWSSFERYGGYAAGFATGLFGFLQVYWKPNRQAVQDQLTFTAVIRDSAPRRVPAPTQ